MEEGGAGLHRLPLLRCAGSKSFAPSLTLPLYEVEGTAAASQKAPSPAKLSRKPKVCADATGGPSVRRERGRGCHLYTFDAAAEVRGL
ncbi:hypothetical protein D2T81_32525 [Azospirillum brasilense]|nr:hypothetical protein D2T81_32525 [Azospirillum brasilense]